MNWREHIVVGFLLASAAMLALGFRDTITLILFGFIGGLAALVPDLDHDLSKGRQILDYGYIGFAFLSSYMSKCGSDVCLPGIEQVSNMLVVFFALVGMYFTFFKFFKPRHRGITHTLLASILFGIMIFLFAGTNIAIAGFAGYLSHLIADQHVRII